MTGFIRGLFSRNKQPRAPKQSRAPKPKQTGAFFLSEDDAKTFGDIDYMRSTKVVRRTFAKKKGQTEELESVRQISAMDKRELDERGRVKPSSMTSSTKFSFGDSSSESSSNGSFQKKETPKFQRSSGRDDGMDMFRNMARDMKKR